MLESRVAGNGRKRGPRLSLQPQRVAYACGKVMCRESSGDLTTTRSTRMSVFLRMYSRPQIRQCTKAGFHISQGWRNHEGRSHENLAPIDTHANEAGFFWGRWESS